MNTLILKPNGTAPSIETCHQSSDRTQNLARAVSTAVERQFNGRVATGANGYDPVNLLKILAYAYLSGLTELQSLRERTRSDKGFAPITRGCALRAETLNRCRCHYFELLKRAVADVLEKASEPAFAGVAGEELMGEDSFARQQRKYLLRLAHLKIREPIFEAVGPCCISQAGINCGS